MKGVYKSVAGNKIEHNPGNSTDAILTAARIRATTGRKMPFIIIIMVIDSLQFFYSAGLFLTDYHKPDDGCRQLFGFRLYRSRANLPHVNKNVQNTRFM